MNETKFRIPLKLFLRMQQNDDSIDCCDTEIDDEICVEHEAYDDPEFPLLKEFTNLFYEKVDVVGLNPVTLDISGLLHRNKDICKEWVKKNWKPEYQELMDNDNGEWEFQFIESFNYILAGHFGEKTHATYVELLTAFRPVPAASDELVLTLPGSIG